MTDKNVKIRRAKHDKENPYYMASRATAQDKTISYEALGLLNYILSKPDDWDIQPTDLEREGCKRNRVYRLLNELIQHQYIERIYERNNKGRILSVEYVAHENPLAASPLPTIQEMDMQEVDIPEVEKRHITEYRKEQNTENTSTAQKSAGKVATPKQRPVFDLVALRSFNIAHVNGDKALGARIGKIESWLKKKNVTLERLEAFYKWYDKKTDKSARPRDVGKFAEWFTQFEAIPVASRIIQLEPEPTDYPDTADYVNLAGGA